MGYTTLLTADELQRHYQNDNWVVVDCRFSLTDTGLGRRLYLESHIPGAVYAHLDEDLSGQIVPGESGRHPLPTEEEFVKTLSNWGVADGVQVAAYDNMGGAIAARLWWMLRQYGHEDVAVLDGAWTAWEEAGYPTLAGEEQGVYRQFTGHWRDGATASLDEIVANVDSGKLRVFDVRAPERYRGEIENIDPVAGHVPGAISAPYADNMGADGKFLSVDALRERYDELFEGVSPDDVVFYCGSGVTSNHSLLAMAHLGITGPRLFVGSWSQWIADSQRPIATGPNP